MALRADVVALQEVDSSVRAAGRIDQLRYLAEATGLRPIAGPALRRHYGDYGNGLLSRLPIIRIRRHDLTVGSFEARAALDVDLTGPFGPLRMLTTHLGFRLRERGRQLQKLVEILGQRGDRRLQVLAGDLNDAVPCSRLSRTLRHGLGAMSAHRTFPSRYPLLPLDRIWVRPASCLLRVEAVRSPLTRVASDHLPLRAVLSSPC